MIEPFVENLKREEVISYDYNARGDIIVNVTLLEPEWEGHVTLEFSNTTPLPAKIYANEGACQFLFLKGESVCETSYADRKGMKQQGVTLPKVEPA
jgi:dCTP deaminase